MYRYTGENYVADTQTTTLTRYFMLSFIYNLRTFAGGKVGGLLAKAEDLQGQLAGHDADAVVAACGRVVGFAAGRAAG